MLVTHHLLLSWVVPHGRVEDMNFMPKCYPWCSGESHLDTVGVVMVTVLCLTHESYS